MDTKIINFSDEGAEDHLKFNIEKFVLAQKVNGFAVDAKGIALHMENGIVLRLEGGPGVDVVFHIPESTMLDNPERVM